MGGLFSCCCPEDEATRLLREEEDREASQAAREQARYAAEQRHSNFERSAGGRAAHKAQAKMRQQNAADDRAARHAIRLFGEQGLNVGDNQPYFGKQLNATMDRHTSDPAGGSEPACPW